jgi:ATP-dependent DNA helicase RecQ
VCACSWTSRTNLAISVRHQRAGGLAENLKFLETLFHDYSHAHAHGDSHRTGSTIVYVPTVRGVENITTHLRTVLPPTVRVESYHGKQGIEDRRRAHLAFLTGEAPVIVATIAFGMGIDKPDIRRIGE